MKMMKCEYLVAISIAWTKRIKTIKRKKKKIMKKTKESHHEPQSMIKKNKDRKKDRMKEQKL